MVWWPDSRLGCESSHAQFLEQPLLSSCLGAGAAPELADEGSPPLDLRGHSNTAPFSCTLLLVQGELTTECRALAQTKAGMFFAGGPG